MAVTRAISASAKDQFWSAFTSLVERFEAVKKLHLDSFEQIGFDNYTLYVSQLAGFATATPSMQDLVTAIRLVFRSSGPVARLPEADREVEMIAEGFRLLLEQWVPEPHCIGFQNASAQSELAFATLPSHAARRKEFVAIADEMERRLDRLRQWENLLRDPVLPPQAEPSFDGGQKAAADQDVPWPDYMSAADLAERLGLEREATRKKLERMAKRFDCFVDNESRRKGEAKRLYRVADVLPDLRR
jgi:hypothetical protein